MAKLEVHRRNKMPVNMGRENKSGQCIHQVLDLLCQTLCECVHHASSSPAAEIYECKPWEELHLFLPRCCGLWLQREKTIHVSPIGAIQV